MDMSVSGMARLSDRKSKNLPVCCHRKATAAGAPLKGKLRDCAYVNQFYIETRYPSDSYIPVSEEEARDCMDAARKLMELLA